jgi:hypothetical protein
MTLDMLCIAYKKVVVVEMFQFLNNVRVKVLKMFSTFYHNLDI